MGRLVGLTWTLYRTSSWQTYSRLLLYVLYSVWYEQQRINTKVLLLARRKSKDVPNISQVKAIRMNASFSNNIACRWCVNYPLESPESGVIPPKRLWWQWSVNEKILVDEQEELMWGVFLLSINMPVMIKARKPDNRLNKNLVLSTKLIM